MANPKTVKKRARKAKASQTGKRQSRPVLEVSERYSVRSLDQLKKLNGDSELTEKPYVY